MRPGHIVAIAILIALLVCQGARAEQAAPQAHSAASSTLTEHMITLDLTLVGGSVGYAGRIGENRYLGFDAGVDVAMLSKMIYAGRHFAEPDGWSYENRDGAINKDLLEILNANLYLRHVYGDHWNIDTGVRASLFLHFDSSDDDPGGGFFGGGYVSAFYGWKRVKFGPRLQAGVFTEGDPEFGVFLSPLIVRVAFPW